MDSPRIGVAVGEGISSMDALKWALGKENLRRGDTLHLLHVYSPGPVGPDQAALRKFQEKRDKKVEKLISRCKRLCHKKEVKTEVHFGESEVVYLELVELILKFSITRIVIGCTEPIIKSSFSSTGFNASYVSKLTKNVCTVVRVQRSRNGIVAVQLQNPSGEDVLGICSQNNSFNSVVSELISEDANTVSSWSGSSRSEPEFLLTTLTGFDDDHINPGAGTSASSSNTNDTWNGLERFDSRGAQKGSKHEHISSGTISAWDNPEEQPADSGVQMGSIDIPPAAEADRLSTNSTSHDRELIDSLPQSRDQDYLSHEIRVLRKQIDQAKISAARAMLEAEQQAKDINLADTIVANAQRLVAESERQRLDALKEAEVAKLQSLEHARKCEQATAAVATISEEKEILRKDCNALTKMIEELQKTVEELSSDLEKETSRRKEAEERATKAVADLKKAQRKYTEYSFRELEIATDNFDEGNKLGEGGYGPVFKGKLLHTPVAVKVLARDGVHGWQEFQREVDLLSDLHHPHLVMLLGACPEKGCIVYEYMSKGSLQDRLTRKDGTPPLPWYVRFRICAEVATALLFLHTRAVPIVHRDMKPGNILLDQNYVSKIGDVGIAKLVSNPAFTRTSHKESSMLKGTMAYMDPEYHRTGVVTCQSDVYALGIVMLQLLTGLTAMGVVDIVEDAVEEMKLHEVLDKEAGDWPLEEATSLARISLQCAEPKKRHRPDLEKEVLPILERLRGCGDRVEEMADASSSMRSAPSSALSSITSLGLPPPTSRSCVSSVKS